MKKSKYNHIIQDNQGKTLAFNATSCALAEVEDKFLDILKNIEDIDSDLCDDETKELITLMRQGDYIIEDGVDELQVLKFKNKKGQFSSNSLGLTIAPTLMCNFKCPYCYETPKNYLMSKKVQDGIVDYVEKNADGIVGLSITWYGGEPLLAKDIIFDLSQRLKKICDKNGVKYDAYMISNGYLLNEDTIEKMLDNDIKGCQITMDGPPEVHNKRRILRSGEGTFNKILENVKTLKNMGGRPSIRVNIDKTNVEAVTTLLNIFKEHNLEDIHINFGQVTAYTEACSSIAGSCLNTEEYSEASINLQKLLHAKGFTADDYPYYPGIKGNYCCADQVNAYVVDPDGFMFKCWNNIGMVEEAVGNILEVENPKMKHVAENINWMSNNPFEGECLDCKLLPICMGGCPYLKKQSGVRSCEKWKYNFESMLRYTYEYKIKKHEQGIELLPEV